MSCSQYMFEGVLERLVCVHSAPPIAYVWRPLAIRATPRRAAPRVQHDAIKDGCGGERHPNLP